MFNAKRQCDGSLGTWEVKYKKPIYDCAQWIPAMQLQFHSKIVTPIYPIKLPEYRIFETEHAKAWRGSIALSKMKQIQ